MIVWINGELLDASKATVSVFDRGFLFGDGVYEGLRASEGVVIAMEAHIQRLRDGLTQTKIRGFDAGRLPQMTAKLLEANQLRDAFLYWQVTRGAPAPGEPLRERVASPPSPTVVGFASPLPSIASIKTPQTRRVALAPDDRWLRGGIKSISLMGSALAAIEASEKGMDDVILHRDGLVTEGAASNVFAIIDGALVTPDLVSASILPGVTRRLLIEASPSAQERPLRVDELLGAEEVMLVGTSTMVASVTHIDGREVGEAGKLGRPGEHAKRLLATLKDTIARSNSDAHTLTP